MSGRKEILNQLFPNNGGIAVMFEKLMDQMGTDDPVEVMKGINSGGWTLSQMPWRGKLKLLKSDIEIVTGEFSKNLFTHGQIKYLIWDNFQSWILNHAPDVIPTFSGKITTLQLSKLMRDPEILKEIGEYNSFSMMEVLAIIKTMTERQPNGEEGDLLANRYANIIYVCLDDGSIIPVRLYWNSVDHEWSLHAFSLDIGDAWGDEVRVLIQG